MKEKMKLSAAIREGAKIRPQAFNNMFDDYYGTLCSCALGAAFEAAFPKYDKNIIAMNRVDTKLFESTYPELNSDVVTPGTGEKQWLQNAIAELNDQRHWTREQIADFVESLGF